jgi:TRAP-type uncharacterized transport system fused permease subunit
MPDTIKCGGRKFLLCVLIVIINALLLLNGDIDAEVYKAIIIATAGAYIAGNVAQKVFAKVNPT